MKPSHMELEADRCVEVCHGDRLVGYVIYFSGGWDLYVADNFGNLKNAGVNWQDKEKAIVEVKRQAAGE